MIGRMIMAAVLCVCVTGCAASAPDRQAGQAAAATCAQQYKPDTAPYNACVNKKTREKSPLAEQMRRVRADEDANAKRAQDPQRDYMTR